MTQSALRVAVQQDAPKLEVSYFVIQRAGGEWSPASKIITVLSELQIAELRAVELKKQFPHQHFAVAMLCSEARHAPNPVEIVRVR